MIETVLGALGVMLSLIGLLWLIHSHRSDRQRTADEDAGAERRTAEALVHWLEGRRVLWAPQIEEIPEETVQSVLEIRKRVEGDYPALQAEEVRRSLELIRLACLALLSEPREHFRHFFSVEAEQALRTFRHTVRPAAEGIASFYGLHPPTWKSFHGGFPGPSISVYAPAPKELGKSKDP